MKVKQILCIIIVLSCILSGCSKDSTKDTSNALKGRPLEKESALPKGSSSEKELGLPKGRSLENELELPKDINADNYYFTKKENKPFLYSFREKPSAIVGYQLDQNGTWVEATPTWLKSLTSLPEGWSYQPQVLEDANGYEYFYYTEVKNDYFKGNLLFSKDGTTYETLKPEGWDEIDPAYGGYKAPAKVTITENGTLAALYYTGEVTTYDPQNYKIQNTISDVRFNESLISSIENQIIVGESENNNALKSLYVYNLNDLKSVKYPFEASIDSYYYCDTNAQNILLCNADGIYKLEKDTSVWNCVVDGSLTSLAMPTLWITGFVSDASNNYYVLFNSDSGYSLKQYSYDATVDTLPSKELNIYSLTDNNILRQAAAVFQQKHTDVKVNIQTVMSMEEYISSSAASKEDYIRALNTELLADNNYDILVLDGLPTDSFIEKGVLTDINDILQPMIDDGTLLKNIMDNYVENGKSYCVPARFAINLTMGSSSNTKQLTSLRSLSDYAQAHSGTPLFGNTTVEDLIKFFIPYQISSLLNTDGKIGREQLIQTLNTLKLFGDNSGIVESYGKRSFDSIEKIDRIWNMTHGDYYCINSVQSLQQAMYSFGILAYIKGTYAPFENSFTPSCEIGISSKGKQQDLSKEFLLTILSEKVQKNDFYDGFPVNTKALMESPSLINKDNIATTSIENAKGEEVKLNFYPLDEKQAKELVSICTSVNKKLTTDEHVVAAIAKRAKDFFTGNQSVSEAADAILEEMNIYLSE